MSKGGLKVAGCRRTRRAKLLTSPSKTGAFPLRDDWGGRPGRGTMTDGRSRGESPPLPGPPPLAPEPPSVIAPPRPRDLWMTMFGVGFATGAGVTLLFLWFTGPIGSWRAPAARGSVTNASGTAGTSFNVNTPVPSQVPEPPPALTGTAPSAALLEGTWGADCPGSRSGAVTFHDDGTMETDGQTGSWSLNGYEMSLGGARDTTMVRWEMLGNDSARVSRPGGASRVVNRCN